jgi:DNA polymerase III epsilon subunit-like protein
LTPQALVGDARKAVAESNPLFAVVDFETTGFSPLVGDRIVEIGIVRIGGDGSTVDEYATLINPMRDIGPTHVHGITQEDVAHAPTFVEALGDVLSRLAGVIFVGHNARYERDFLAAELTSAGIFLPAIPSLCTLKLGYRLHPELMNYRLGSCCEAAGLVHGGPHSAIEDARATAKLLSCYLAEAQSAGIETLRALGLDPVGFPDSWPEFFTNSPAIWEPISAVATECACSLRPVNHNDVAPDKTRLKVGEASSSRRSVSPCSGRGWDYPRISPPRGTCQTAAC